MAEWKENSALEGEQLDQVAAFVAAFSTIPADMTPDEWLKSPGVSEHPGKRHFVEDCGTCHVIKGLSEGGLRRAPDLFGWGSPQWTRRMIRKPGSADKYGFLQPKDQMPAFGHDQMSDNDVDMVIRYMKGDYPRATPESSRELKGGK
jgi:ubiquinol-cytochrome c reductase cytochrome b subunit